MAVEFERCVAAVPAEQLAPLCETPFGFHVIRRDPVVEASGVLFSALSNGPGRAGITRAASAVVAGADPNEAAATHSVTYAILDEVPRGQLLPDIEAVLFSLEPDSSSDPVDVGDTSYVVVRTR